MCSIIHGTWIRTHEPLVHESPPTTIGLNLPHFSIETTFSTYLRLVGSSLIIQRRVTWAAR